MTFIYILCAIFIFGFLIFSHELGHFIAARSFDVQIREFAIGMGPKVFSRVSKKTGIRYSLRLFPIGGFVSMVGEDEESDNPRALSKKPVWQRLIITVAGATMNLVIGILVMFILVISSSDKLPSSTIYYPENDSVIISQNAGLQTGDTVTKVDGVPIHTGYELVYEIMRRGTEPLDLTVVRDGVTLTLSDITFPVETEHGMTYGVMDFKVLPSEDSFGNAVKFAFYRSLSTIKMIWESLYDLVTGRYGIEAVSGPVGTTETIVETAKSGGGNLVYLAVVISMNLGIFNLLPFPALDGGRVVFLLLEIIRRKKINPNIEGYINFAGLAILMLFMFFIMIKDVFSLFS